MKPKNNTVTPRFAAEIRFAVGLAPAPPFRGSLELALEELKQRLLQEQLAASPGAALNPLYRRAANDAASLAWTTSHPLLLFPGLFAEKAAEARRRGGKQEDVRRASLTLIRQLEDRAETPRPAAGRTGLARPTAARRVKG